MASRTPLVVAMMATGRDAPTLARSVPQLRDALDARVRLVLLVDEAKPSAFEAVAHHLDALVVAPALGGFAAARRRSLSMGLSFEPEAVLVCDGDGLYPAASIADLAHEALATPGVVAIAQRRGHTLPGATTGLGGATREDLERAENAAGALLIRRPDHARRDLQPGAMVLPAEVARAVLDDVTSRDFAWELECVLSLLRLRTRRIAFPEVTAAPQSTTSFAGTDAGSKFAMLARHFGRDALVRVLDELRAGTGHHGVAPGVLDAIGRAI